MKTTLLKIKYFLLTSTVIFALSCNPEDGEDGMDGAPGIQGEQGDAGQDGADGTNGQDGEDGNANVIASEWFGPEDQEQITNGFTSYAEFERSIENIDPVVFETGTLLVFARLENFVPEVWPSGHTAQLPITVFARVAQHHYTYYFSPTNLKIRYRRSPEQEFISFSPSSRFRYVIIPASTTGRTTQPDFAKMSYKEVMDYLGLDF